MSSCIQLPQIRLIDSLTYLHLGNTRIMRKLASVLS